VELALVEGRVHWAICLGVERLQNLAQTMPKLLQVRACLQIIHLLPNPLQLLSQQISISRFLPVLTVLLQTTIWGQMVRTLATSSRYDSPNLCSWSNCISCPYWFGWIELAQIHDMPLFSVMRSLKDSSVFWKWVGNILWMIRNYLRGINIRGRMPLSL